MNIDPESLIEAAEMYRQIHSAKSKDDFIQSTTKNEMVKPPSFDSITMDEVRNKLGRKWRSAIKNMTKLASVIEKIWIDSRISNTITIAQTSPLWMDLLGKSRHQQVGAIIRQALTIGLLKLRADAEFFNHSAARYWVNHELAKMLIDHANEPEDIHCTIEHQVNETLRKYLLGKFKDESCKATPISIKSQCRLPSMTNEQVVCGIYEQYPQYLDLLLDLGQVNALLQEDERFLCCPSVDRDKHGNVIRIGLRAHNPWCHVKKREGLDEVNPDEKHREDLLDQKFGHWMEYDIKACVPSVTLLLTTGKWRDDHEDLYEISSGVHFKDKAQRDLFKRLFLPMYFSASPQQAVARSMSEARRHCLQYTKEQWDNLAKVFCSGMYRMAMNIGCLGSEIFLHESCIEAKALLRMLKKGWHVVDVYDGFFIQTDGTQEDEDAKREEASRLVKEVAEEYYRKWFSCR